MHLSKNQKYAAAALGVVVVGVIVYEFWGKKALAAGNAQSTSTVQPPGSGQYVNASYTTGGAMTTLDVQKALNALGAQPPLTQDGLNGPQTTAAVRSFQAKMGITVDGIVGPQTVNAIQTALAALGGASAASSLNA